MHVQIKLTVVPPDAPEDVVPNISRFANSQNKIDAADFFSNHPFHLRVEDFSRRMFAPPARRSGFMNGQRDSGSVAVNDLKTASYRKVGVRDDI